MFLMSALGLGVALAWDDTQSSVKLARATQGFLTVILAITCTIAWMKFPSVPAQRSLPENSTLWTSGFQQVLKTTRALYRDHRHTLFMFMLSVATSEAFAYSLTTLSVVFLGNALGLTSTEAIVFFLVAMVGGFVGPFLAAAVAAKLDLKNSWRFGLIGMMLSCVLGGFALPRRALIPTYVWGLFVGMFQSWHYTMERAMFSVILPTGQDSELSGFFVYCHIILSWLPPLIYSALVQSKLNQRWALVSLSIFGLIGVGTLSLLQVEEKGNIKESTDSAPKAIPAPELENSAMLNSDEDSVEC